MFPLALLSGLLFGGDVDRLGHPDYRTRTAAHARLARCLPLSLPAVRAGTRSATPETARRCRAVLDQADRHAADLTAAWLLIGPGDVIGSRYAVGGPTRPAVVRSVNRLATRAGLVRDGEDWEAPAALWVFVVDGTWHVQYEHEGHVHGLAQWRYRLRGMPDPEPIPDPYDGPE